MIDGTANIDTSIGTPAAVLSVDAIEEFKEQTTTYSAEYGFSSNQINLVSKTGTNAFHGTALRVLPERRLGRPELLRRQDLRGAEARSEAVRVRRRRSGDAARLQRPEPDVLPRQLRRDPHRPRRDELLHRADAAGAERGASTRPSSIRSPASRSRTTPFRSRGSRSSPSSPSATAGSRRRTARPRRATSRTCGRSRRSRTSSRSAGTRTSGSSAACSSAIRTPATRTRRPRT